MLISLIRRVPARTLFGRRGFLSSRLSISSADSVQKAFRKPEAWSWRSRYHTHHQSNSCLEAQVDPFSLVTDELSLISEQLKSMVAAEVPELSLAAQYFFKSGVEGKKMCMTVLLLMARSFNVCTYGASLQLRDSLCERQRLMAGVAEIIHVTSLIHDDVLDEANTRRGVGSLNSVMGNKLAILAGDFLLSRAIAALASLKNTEAVSLMATVVANLVTGETMQMTAACDKYYSMEFYMQKTYNKTASLISNGCKAIAVLSDETEEVAKLAFEYGKNLGLAYQLIDDILDFTGTPATLGKASLSDIRNGIITAPILFAIEEFPELRVIVDSGFDNPTNLDTALEYLKKSTGIQRTRELATKHAELAAAAICSLPEAVNQDATKARAALVNLTQIILTRQK